VLQVQTDTTQFHVYLQLFTKSAKQTITYCLHLHGKRDQKPYFARKGRSLPTASYVDCQQLETHRAKW